MADHEPADRERVFTRALRGNIRRDTRFLGGESVGSLVDRVVPAFESLLAASDWRAMAIVAHGGTNRAILCRALGVGVEAFASLEQDAGCLNIIDVDSDSSFLVRLVNYTPYSPVKDGLRATTMERIWLSHVAPRPSGPPRTRGER
jgi:probable phosphoglycerate mutase